MAQSPHVPQSFELSQVLPELDDEEEEVVPDEELDEDEDEEEPVSPDEDEDEDEDEEEELDDALGGPSESSTSR
jgi:hypothetical protein